MGSKHFETEVEERKESGKSTDTQEAAVSSADEIRKDAAVAAVLTAFSFDQNKKLSKPFASINLSHVHCGWQLLPSHHQQTNQHESELHSGAQTIKTGAAAAEQSQEQLCAYSNANKIMKP